MRPRSMLLIPALLLLGACASGVTTTCDESGVCLKDYRSNSTTLSPNLIGWRFHHEATPQETIAAGAVVAQSPAVDLLGAVIVGGSLIAAGSLLEVDATTEVPPIVIGP